MKIPENESSKYKVGEGENFPMYEEGRGRVVLFAITTGVAASLIAAVIIWCFTGIALPDTCRLVFNLMQVN